MNAHHASGGSPELLLPGSQESSVNGAAKPKAGWSRKRKIWNAIVILAAVALVVVAVVVPVVLTQRSKNKQPTYSELYLPEGYNGTGLNGVLEGSRQNKTYDRLLV